MLIRFVAKNYRSIGTEMEFNMLPASYLKTHPDHVADMGKLRILKPSVLYGANGAGKSNMFLGMKFLRDIVTGDTDIPDSTHHLINRLVPELKEAPIHLEVEFSYHNYFCAYSLEFKDGVILDEELYELGFEKDDRLIFERKHDSTTGKITVETGKDFHSSQDELLVSILESNLLSPKIPVLRLASVIKKEIVSVAYDWFRLGIEIIFPQTKFSNLVPELTESVFNDFANKLLRSYNTGIEKLSIERISLDSYGLPPKLLSHIKNLLAEDPASRYVLDDTDGTVVINDLDGPVVLKPKSGHIGNDGNEVSLDLSDESDGSQRLLQYVPIFKRLSTEDITFFIDEIERSIHPSLLKGLVGSFLSHSGSITGQLVFSTHECNLLDLKVFRKDEIWFAQKKQNETSLYPLSDFDIRQDLDIEKGYLMGRFGAVPFLGNIRDLQWK
ncbi:MAG: ATP-binding protein [Bacteroidales bacterium]|nr:ATP-binding protein [Bacteroidales bacterium]